MVFSLTIKSIFAKTIYFFCLFFILFYPNDLHEFIYNYNDNELDKIYHNYSMIGNFGVFKQLIQFLLALSLNIAIFLFVVLKIFRTLCYTKLTMEWFPMLNPFLWPYSFLQVLTSWYFEFWSVILPTIRLQKTSINVSVMISLEALNALSYFMMRFVNCFTDLLIVLEKSA